MNTKSIAYLGPNGSYSEIAAEKAATIFGIDKFKSEYCFSIRKVIEKVSNNPEFIGVIPFENSIEGIVREAVDTLIFSDNNLNIFYEFTIPINNCLISKSNDIKTIKKVVSYVQPIAQCQHFLHSELPIDLEIINAPSTSEAVKIVSELDETYAAIGNTKSAELYGLNILREGINDNPDNTTRFICISHQQAKQTGNDKTSLSFTAINKAGSLADVLMVFKNNEINLSYIDSRPSKTTLGSYSFLIDFEGHVDDKKTQNLITEITPLVSNYKILGSYPIWTKN